VQFHIISQLDSPNLTYSTHSTFGTNFEGKLKKEADARKRQIQNSVVTGIEDADLNVAGHFLSVEILEQINLSFFYFFRVSSIFKHKESQCYRIKEM
jgi:hypothetical protein